jgi:hypothetical protein
LSIPNLNISEDLNEEEMPIGKIYEDSEEEITEEEIPEEEIDNLEDLKESGQEDQRIEEEIKEVSEEDLNKEE